MLSKNLPCINRGEKVIRRATDQAVDPNIFHLHVSCFCWMNTINDLLQKKTPLTLHKIIIQNNVIIVILLQIRSCPLLPVQKAIREKEIIIIFKCISSILT